MFTGIVLSIWAAAEKPAPPAGWYPDPSRELGLRYWDGDAWTQQVIGLPDAA